MSEDLEISEQIREFTQPRHKGFYINHDYSDSPLELDETDSQDPLFVTIDDTIGLMRPSSARTQSCNIPRFREEEFGFSWLMESSVDSLPLTVEMEKDELEPNPCFGTLMMILKGILSVLSRFVIKMIYLRHPELSVWQFLFVRSAICAAFNLTFTNVNTKRLLWDDIIEKKQITPLFYSIVQGCLCIVISSSCLKFLPVTVVGISSQLTPMMVIVLAYFFLSERITPFETVSVLCMICSACLVLCGNTQSDKPEAMDQEFKKSAFLQTLCPILLFLMPLLNASGQIATRHMRKLHYIVQTANFNIVLTVVSAAILLGLNQSMTFAMDFGAMTWFLISLMTVLCTFDEVCKFLAFKHQEASQLQVYQFMPITYQFAIDVLVIHKDFSLQQIIGIGGFIVFYSVYGAKKTCESQVDNRLKALSSQN